MDRFSFSLGQEVRLVRSGEAGVVVGRAEYTDAAPSYFVRYAAADGRLDERWWAQSALEAADAGSLCASQA
ncbi:hypothetical protein [Methylobacterium sp. GC_Met_2]|uniref:hypothetical protein n=1 Tax=Methylobacterium sp. GC_Met_2 TaxID=2937376 RepID=UPI00226B5E44|nr:hypothetical protein [Methylobacterium sp. GC_Met_2]